MAGGYIFCEWESVKEEYPDFQRAMASLENASILKASSDWKKNFNLGRALTPASDEFGRTTILPALFDPNPLQYGGGQFGAAAAVAGFSLPPAYWRQYFGTAGNQTLIQGCRGGETLPEDFKVAWIGLAFPNKQQQITEIKFQIGDTKYGRLNLEEIHSYNKPAIIFEEGFIIDEEQSFHLYGYVEEVDYQRIVMLGSSYFRYVDKVLGNCGAII